MKAILKVIWFALAVILKEYIIVTQARYTFLVDKLNAYSPIELVSNFLPKSILNNLSPQYLATLSPEKWASLLNPINEVVLFIVIFLGLDIIGGDIKGIIKGPIKLIFNAIIYFIGFSIVFFALDGISISFTY